MRKTSTFLAVFLVTLFVITPNVRADLVFLSVNPPVRSLVFQILYRFIWTFLFELPIFALMHGFKKGAKWCLVVNIVSVPLLFISLSIVSGANYILPILVLLETLVIVLEYRILATLNKGGSKRLLTTSILANIFSFVIGSASIMIINIIIAEFLYRPPPLGSVPFY